MNMRLTPSDIIQRSGKSLSLVALVALAVAACNTSNFKGSSDKLNPTISKDFVQDNLPIVTATKTQAKAGTPQAQNFEQGQWGPLDLVVVIDNSGSMAEEQANLATKLNPLLSKIDKSDWQIAVVTTDPADGCQRALIKKSDANYMAKFQDAINAGTSGSGLERPILQAVDALKATCIGAQQWVRPNSTISVLIVTDEDNCHLDNTLGYGCDGLAWKDGKYLLDYLASIRTVGKDARVYGIVWHPSMDQTQCTTALSQATIVADVIDQASGKWGSICDADYTKTLTAISTDIAQIVKYEFDLAQEPDAGTLKILVDGKAWDKYEVHGLHVKFSEPPPFGSKVAVQYSYGAQEPIKDFPLEKAPVGDSIKVTVNGDGLAADQYKWNPATKTVEFASAPADSSEIKFDYKEDAKLKVDFDLGTTDVDAKTIAVTVSGVATSKFSFDAKKGVITFETPPPEGAKIHVSYKAHP